jgi:hypothetical protein
MKQPLRGFRERREAQALQDALERYERAVGLGTDAASARSEAARDLGPLARPFALATSMAGAAAPISPDAAFARRVAMQLRSAQVAPRAAVRRRAPFLGFAPLAAAAAVVAAAVVLIPSFGALPGQPLYSVKGMSEDARVWFASGSHEARVRLSLANERFGEVEELIEASRVRVMGGPGLLAAGVTTTDTDDPELAHLIEAALRNAGEQLEAAAEILTEAPAEQADLDTLVEVTTRGRQLATNVAEDLPNPEQPPVLRAAVKLAKIEAKAKAAQMTAQVAEPSPEPCPSPTPTPSPSPTPDASATPTPTPTPTATPATEETERAPATTDSSAAASEEAASPCPSVEPTPSPTPTVEPEPSAEPTPTTPTEEQSATVDENDDGEPSDVAEEPEETHRRPLSPFGERA